MIGEPQRFPDGERAGAALEVDDPIVRPWEAAALLLLLLGLFAILP